MVRARSEEEPDETTSEDVAQCEVIVSKGGTVVVGVKPVIANRPINEDLVMIPAEEASVHVAIAGMHGTGPFRELLAIAGYKPW